MVFVRDLHRLESGCRSLLRLDQHMEMFVSIFHQLI